MAAADYRLCDVCGCKTFYDSELSYDNSVSGDDPNAYRIAGERSPFGMSLGNLGDWAVLCKGCAKTHRTRIELIHAGVAAPFKCGLDGAASLCQSCKPSGQCKFGARPAGVTVGHNETVSPQTPMEDA
jgi:hypothetical protein